MHNTGIFRHFSGGIYDYLCLIFGWWFVVYNIFVLDILGWGPGVCLSLPYFCIFLFGGMERCAYISWHGYLDRYFFIIPSE